MKTRILLLFGSCWCLLSLAQATFTSVDIGSQKPAGSTTATADGYDVVSATGDIWGFGDDCRFVYQGVAGDFDFQARVQGLTGPAYWAKAGLMLRHSLVDGSGEFSMLATRSSGFGYYACMSRYVTGYSSYSPFASTLVGGKVSYPNSWVRLIRVGDQAVAQHSTNGVDWVQIGVETLYEAFGSAFVGLAVSTHTDAVGSKTTAQFRDIQLLRNQVAAPAVVVQPESRIMNPGASLSLKVESVGQPPLAYQWFKNGGMIPNATQSSLPFSNLTADDAGKYSCFISNGAGQVWSWVSALEIVPAHEPFDGILYERFGQAQGLPYDYIVNLPIYPDKPQVRSWRNLAELPSNVAEFIGSRLRGYLLAPQTGLYTFWIAADDNGSLWLSTDDNPAAERFIAWCPFYVSPRQWAYYDTQQSDPVFLEAGKRYYFEAQFKESDVVDHGAVGWQLPDARLERPIPLARFRGAAPSLSITAGPATRITVTGTPGSPYVLQRSIDLANWEPVITNRAPFELAIGASPAELSRFFRAATER